MQSPVETPPALPLAALQSRMAAALLAADQIGQELPENLFAGAHPGAVGLRVHRNTVLGALSNALRASFVSVERLVGEDFFDRMAVAYARATPPRAPQLDAYGADFPAFIVGFPATEALPYLAELARFDWQLDELGARRADDPAGARSLLLADGVRLHLAPSLRVHQARYRVEALRAAILAADIAALTASTRESGEHAIALWRDPEGVKALRLGDAVARFLVAALAGADGEQALSAAAADRHPDEIAAILAAELLPAGFVRIERAPPDLPAN